MLEMHEGMAKAYNSQQEYESELNASDKCETIDAFPKLYYYQKAVSQFLINIDISSSYNELKVSAPMVRLVRLMSRVLVLGSIKEIMEAMSQLQRELESCL